MKPAFAEPSPEPPSYDELLQDFKRALARVLSGSILPPSTAIPDGPLTTALLDIAYAVRDGRPTNYLVSRACFQFAQFAALRDSEGAPPATRPESGSLVS